MRHQPDNVCLFSYSILFRKPRADCHPPPPPIALHCPAAIAPSAPTPSPNAVASSSTTTLRVLPNNGRTSGVSSPTTTSSIPTSSDMASVHICTN
ncbi:hypothetical protein SprV_0200669700 [Sparganum proliferum]